MPMQRVAPANPARPAAIVLILKEDIPEMDAVRVGEAVHHAARVMTGKAFDAYVATDDDAVSVENLAIQGCTPIP